MITSIYLITLACTNLDNNIHNNDLIKYTVDRDFANLNTKKRSNFLKNKVSWLFKYKFLASTDKQYNCTKKECLYKVIVYLLSESDIKFESLNFDLNVQTEWENIQQKIKNSISNNTLFAQNTYDRSLLHSFEYIYLAVIAMREFEFFLFKSKLRKHVKEILFDAKISINIKKRYLYFLYEFTNHLKIVFFNLPVNIQFNDNIYKYHVFLQHLKLIISTSPVDLLQRKYYKRCIATNISFGYIKFKKYFNSFYYLIIDIIYSYNTILDIIQDIVDLRIKENLLRFSYLEDLDNTVIIKNKNNKELHKRFIEKLSEENVNVFSNHKITLLFCKLFKSSDYNLYEFVKTTNDIESFIAQMRSRVNN